MKNFNNPELRDENPFAYSEEDVDDPRPESLFIDADIRDIDIEAL